MGRFLAFIDAKTDKGIASSAKASLVINAPIPAAVIGISLPVKGPDDAARAFHT